MMSSAPRRRIERITHQLASSRAPPIGSNSLTSTTMSPHAGARPPITSHALDTAVGRPAQGLPLKLDRMEDTGEWSTLGNTTTNEDGRAPGLMASGTVRAEGMCAAELRSCALLQFAASPAFRYMALSVVVAETTPPGLPAPARVCSKRGSGSSVDTELEEGRRI